MERHVFCRLNGADVEGDGVCSVKDDAGECYGYQPMFTYISVLQCTFLH